MKRISEENKERIARLKAEREEYRRKARELKDEELAKMFHCHVRSIERIPVWE